MALAWVLCRRVAVALLPVDDVLLRERLLLVVWRSVATVVGIGDGRSVVVWCSRRRRGTCVRVV
jgi:hypothetical protein